MAVSAKTLTFHLSEDAVGQISSLTAEALKEGNIEEYDIERLHLAVEQVLLKWLDVLGEGTEGTYRSGKRLGRQYINLSVIGPRVNPFGEDGGDCVLNGGNSVQTLLANIGLTPSYHYVNGENQISLMPKRKKINPLIYLLCSIFAGVFVGLLCRELPYDLRHTVSEIVVIPLFDTFIGLLIATALPMMFLSLI